MRRCRIRTPQRVQHTARRRDDIGVAEIVVGELGDRRCRQLDGEYRRTAVLVGRDDQRAPSLDQVSEFGRRSHASATDRGCSPNRMYCNVIRGARSGVEMVSRVKATAEPSGEIAGCSKLGVWIVGDHAAFPGRQLDPHQHRPLGGSGAGDPPRRHQEAAVGADVESGFQQRRHPVAGSGRAGPSRRADGVRPGRCPCSRSALDSPSAGSPSPDRLCAARAAADRRRRRAPPATTAAPITTSSAPRAVRTALTPPGTLNTSTASPPPAGSRHSEAGGFVPSSAQSAVGRDETNSRSPSMVNAGDESPLALRVSRRAGRWPAGSISQTAPMCSFRLSLSSVTVVTTRDPSADTASPETRGNAR